MSPFCWCLSSLRITIFRMGLWEPSFLLPGQMGCHVQCWKSAGRCRRLAQVRIKQHLHACIQDSLTWALSTIIQMQCTQCTHYLCTSTIYDSSGLAVNAQKQCSSPLACLKQFSAAVVLLLLFIVQKRIIAPLLCSTSLLHLPIIMYFHPTLSGAGNALWFSNFKSPICHDMLQSTEMQNLKIFVHYAI